MEKLEEYLNSIISRQERLEKMVFKIVITLIIFYISIFALHSINVEKIDFGNPLILHAAIFISITLAMGLYVIIRLHACMNGCDLIKIRLSQGGLEAAEHAMNNTPCTKDLDIDKLKTLLAAGRT